MKAILVLLMGVLPAYAAFEADGEPVQATHKLPAGFMAVPESGMDASGWPREIRCEKDGAVMVFVPSAEHTTGLSPEQLKALARLELTLEGDKLEKPADLAVVRRELLQGLRAVEIREFLLPRLMKQSGFAGDNAKSADGKNEDEVWKLVIESAETESPGQWTDLLMLFWVMDRLEKAGKPLSDEDMEKWKRPGNPVSALKEIPAVRDEWAAAEKELTQVAETEVENLDLERVATTWVLRRLERKHKEIAKNDLEQWKRGGAKWKELIEIPALREDLKGLGLEGDSIETLTLRVDPDARIADRARALSANFGKPNKTEVGAFYIDKYEVTNEQYRRFMAEEKDERRLPGMAGGGHSYNMWTTPNKLTYKLWDDRKRNHDRQPVTCVSGQDASAYARWAGKAVPTGVEWQRAATGDDNRLFPWGSDFDPSMCRSNVAMLAARAERPSGKAGAAIAAYMVIKELKNSTIPSEVGLFPRDASPFGCMDMAGNVSEWVRESRGDYGTAGGNSSSLKPNELAPARANGPPLLHPYRVLGFRTVLAVEERE